MGKGVKRKRGKERERCRERGKQSRQMGEGMREWGMGSKMGEGGKEERKLEKRDFSLILMPLSLPCSCKSPL